MIFNTFVCLFVIDYLTIGNSLIFKSAIPIVRNEYALYAKQLNHDIANKYEIITDLPINSANNFQFASNLLQHLNDEEEADEDDNESSSEETVPVPEEVTTIADDPQISLIKEGIKFPTSLNGSDVRVGIIMARWNADIIQGLYKGVNESLTKCGVKPSNVFTTYVPGAFELPITARFLAASKRVDVIICLGCLIKGDTMHFEYIAQATSNGIMQVALESYVPCIFGVLTVLNKQQAIDRSEGEKNEGLSWGTSAVEMGLARMSALGFDKMAKKASAAAAFVNFNSTGVDTAKNATNTPKKFGF
eukprot:gene7830-10636_t